MPTAAVVASGTLLWIFVIAVPVAHLGLLGLLGRGEIAMALAPLGVLVVAVARASRPIALIGFPVSLLPFLLARPDAMGSRVYGIAPFAALAASTLLYLGVLLAPAAAGALGPGRRRGGVDTLHREHRALLAQSAVHGVLWAALAYAATFHRPVRALVARAYPGYEDRALVRIGLVMFAAWCALVGRHLVGHLSAALLERRRLLGEWYRFELGATDVDRVRSALVWSLLVGALSATALFAVVAFGR